MPKKLVSIDATLTVTADKATPLLVSILARILQVSGATIDIEHLKAQGIDVPTKIHRLEGLNIKLVSVIPKKPRAKRPKDSMGDWSGAFT